MLTILPESKSLLLFTSKMITTPLFLNLRTINHKLCKIIELCQHYFSIVRSVSAGNCVIYRLMYYAVLSSDLVTSTPWMVNLGIFLGCFKPMTEKKTDRCCV